MSRGLSRIQNAIVGLLGDHPNRQRFAGCGALTTSELAKELQAKGLVDWDTAPQRKMAFFTVRRACDSLLARGILQGEYVIEDERPWPKTISWSLVTARAAEA